MTARILNVWWDSRFVGQFTQDRHGDISFAYTEARLDDEMAPPFCLPSKAPGTLHPS